MDKVWHGLWGSATANGNGRSGSTAVVTRNRLHKGCVYNDQASDPAYVGVTAQAFGERQQEHRPVLQQHPGTSVVDNDTLGTRIEQPAQISQEDLDATTSGYWECRIAGILGEAPDDMGPAG